MLGVGYTLLSTEITCHLSDNVLPSMWQSIATSGGNPLSLGMSRHCHKAMAQAFVRHLPCGKLKFL